MLCLPFNTTLDYLRAFFPFLLFFFVLTSGCALSQKHKLDSLESTTDEYSAAIRWGYYERASQMLESTDDEQLPQLLPELKKIKVSSYEILARKIIKEKMEAEQIVEIKYYHTDYLIERTLIDNQLWKYDEENKKWELISGLPNFQQ